MSSATRAACGVVFASFVVTVTAPGQSTRAQFGVGASLTIPTGDFHADAGGDGFNAGWQGIALVDIRPAGRPVGFRVDATYGENSGNDQLNADLTAAVGAPTTAKTKLLGVNADVTYHFRRSSGGLQGYVLGGIGVYNVKLAVTSGGATADSSETKFTWNVGGGLVYGVVFFEARYVAVSSAFGGLKTTFLPFTAGVRFGGK